MGFVKIKNMVNFRHLESLLQEFDEFSEFGDNSIDSKNYNRDLKEIIDEIKNSENEIELDKCKTLWNKYITRIKFPNIDIKKQNLKKIVESFMNNFIWNVQGHFTEDGDKVVFNIKNKINKINLTKNLQDKNWKNLLPKGLHIKTEKLKIYFTWI